ncbi:hypothetical protein [Lichenifustis flavocetrariae]|uniref:Uncharacterized protein n=1 Tax=Lichenifustis flavocetrariae TaxID=2949735 RepID=A0AA41Z499_9HYPH|nr:hypothetical protein [Lichenifustis flavocetrariae]MCW6510060.1 hypothetical protein [Lichenifustis flavocetrariae]
MPLREIEHHPTLMVEALARLRPVRRMPIWIRYLLTLAIVLVFFAARAALTDVQGSPFLLFLPAIVLTSFLFDRGSGLVATFFSTALAI